LQSWASLFLTISFAAVLTGQSSIPCPNPKIKGQRFIVQDDKGTPLNDAQIIHIHRFDPQFAPNRTDETARVLELSVSVDPLRKEIINQIYQSIEEFEFLTYISNGQHSLLKPSLTGLTENGIFKIGVTRTPAKPSNNLGSERPYWFGAFWVVFKPGYHPAVVFEDWNKATNEEWIDHKVGLVPWPERQATLFNRPYVLENLQLQKEIQTHWAGRDPGSRPLFGKDPFVVWEERLQTFQLEALKRGNRLDAAWLELALAKTSKRTSTGYRNDGDMDDYVNGRVWKALDRMVELAPEMKQWRAFRDYRNFVLGSPMGLNQLGFPSERNKNFNDQTPWTMAGLDMFLSLLDKYRDDFLIYVTISNTANCNGFWRSEPKIRDRFFLNRIPIMGQWVKRSPSSLWFCTLDSLCSNLTACKGFYYPLVYQEEFKQILHGGR